MSIYLNMDSLKDNWSHSDSTGNMRLAALISYFLTYK